MIQRRTLIGAAVVPAAGLSAPALVRRVAAQDGKLERPTVQAIVEAGRLESTSLFARFGFTQEALLTAAAQWLKAKRQGPAAKPREVSTYVHELMHYLQYTTTPYGMFLQYCRILQSHATIGMVNALFAAKCPVK